MRKTIIIFGPLLLMTCMLFSYLYFNNYTMNPLNPDCKINLSEKVKTFFNKNDLSKPWEVYFWDGNGKAPNVLISELSDLKLDKSGRNYHGCVFSYHSDYNPNTTGVDWRIGKKFSALSIKGKKLKTIFWLKANKNLTLHDANVYTYDGFNVKAVATTQLSKKWKKFEVITDIDNEAKNFEIWYRVFWNNPRATPQEGDIYMIAQIAAIE